MDEIFARFEKEETKDSSNLLKELSMIQKDLKIRKDRLGKIEMDYENEELSATAYSRISDKIQLEIAELEKTILNLKREIEKNNTGNNISKELIIEALSNFNELFGIASAEEKKILVRSIIKEVEVEHNRKEIKKVTFWLSLNDDLPSNKTRGTVS